MIAGNSRRPCVVARSRRRFRKRRSAAPRRLAALFASDAIGCRSCGWRAATRRRFRVSMDSRGISPRKTERGSVRDPRLRWGDSAGPCGAQTVRAPSTSILVDNETAVGFARRAHDRLAADIEAGVDQDRNAGQRFEFLQQLVIPSVPLGIDRLNSGRIVDVRDGGNDRTNVLQLIDSAASGPHRR